MANLKEFTANNCGGITRLPASLFSGSGRLESITLEMNFNLERIETGAFAGAGNVKTLRMMELRGLTTLDDVYGQSVLGGLDGLTDLTIASDYGGIAEITATSFAGLASLERVELKLAAMTSIASGSFRDAANLQKVSISAAPELTQLPAGLFDAVRESVQEVVFAELGVAVLLPGLFAGMSSMVILEISCCTGLTALVSNQFNLPNLEELSVANNPSLRTLERNTFAGCSKLRSLAVTGNPRLATLPAGTFVRKINLCYLGRTLVGLRSNPHQYTYPLEVARCFMECMR